MKTENEKITSIDVTATVRPIKLAFLIDANTQLHWVIDEVIPWFSSVWGGGHYFFVPVFNNFGDDPSFEKWMKLLQKFDPDRVISTGNFPKNFLELVKSHLLIRADVFQFNPQSVATPKMITRGDQYTIPFEDLFSLQGTSISFSEFAPTGSVHHDLWFFSLFGRLGKYSSLVAGNGNGTLINNSTIASVDIERHCENIVTYRHLNNFTGSPLLKSMNYLGYAGGPESFDDYKMPYVIVIGELIQDWCLFQSLLYFYPGVRWIPQSFLSSQNSGSARPFDSLLWRLLTGTDKLNPPILTSASLPPVTISGIVAKSLRARA